MALVYKCNRFGVEGAAGPRFAPRPANFSGGLGSDFSQLLGLRNATSWPQKWVPGPGQQCLAEGRGRRESHSHVRNLCCYASD
jgi:hypothetical protein